MRSDRRSGNARRFLFLYWLYKVLSGSDPLKSAIRVMLMEKNFDRKEYQKEKAQSQKPVENASSDRKGSAKGIPGIPGGIRGKILRSALKSTLKKQRIY